MKMPQKHTTTACFIQEESSGGRPEDSFLLDETGCSGKFLRHLMTIRYTLSICHSAL